MSFRRFSLFIPALGLLLALTAGSAQAALVYGQPATLTGTRTIGNGLTGTGVYSASDFTIEWIIVDNGNETYTYTYVLSGFEGLQGGGVSHFTLDLSDDFDNDTVTNATMDGGPVVVEFGDKDGVTGAVKFDDGSDFDGLAYSFTSNRVPVWHNVFVKAGQGDAQNTGLGNEGVSMDEIDFVAAPNSQIVNPPPIPEPSTIFLFGVGLLGVLGVARKCARK